jgi:hypothetical protein
MSKQVDLQTSKRQEAGTQTSSPSDVKTSGSQVVQTSRPFDINTAGSQVAQTPRHLDIKTSGSQEDHTSRPLDVKTSGSQEDHTSRPLDVKTSGSQEDHTSRPSDVQTSRLSDIQTSAGSQEDLIKVYSERATRHLARVQLQDSQLARRLVESPPRILGECYIVLVQVHPDDTSIVYLAWDLLKSPLCQSKLEEYLRGLAGDQAQSGEVKRQLQSEGADPEPKRIRLRSPQPGDF